MMIWIEPIVMVEANTAWALSQPSIWLMVLDDTPPVMMRVIARLAPARTKNVPRVTRKLGSPVMWSSQPLNAPTPSENARAIATPPQTFSPRYHAA